MRIAVRALNRYAAMQLPHATAYRPPCSLTFAYRVPGVNMGGVDLGLARGSAAACQGAP